MKKTNILWGIVFVILGIILGLNALEITNINIFFSGWWTLFIIVPSFIDLFNDHDKTGSIIGLVIGITLLLAAQDLISYELIFKLCVPTILVIIGLSLIFKDLFQSNIKKAFANFDSKNAPSHFVAFGGENFNYDNEEFKGCEMNAIFGGLKCDLKKAKIKDDVVIKATSIFGGIDLLVPDNVNIKVTAIPIFGGVSNKTITKENSTKTIYIKATCLFGGLEIR